ncbi:MAG: pantetheine-phosphate adenylyltransferase [Treponema sp. CETP13]|nr:MAG: pantetheine-phosphate adenylyltransferase [Treponema sp. CETP13]
MINALYPGSFDPPTFGHLNIIERSHDLFTHLDIVIAVNKNKKYLFSAQERLDLMTKLVSKYNNVSVHLWDKLIVDYAQEHNANVLLRGIRNFTDFAYEFDLSQLNRGLNGNIETLFLPTVHEFSVLKSSSIKELASFGGDVSKMVPKIVDEALKRKYGFEKKL